MAKFYNINPFEGMPSCSGLSDMIHVSTDLNHNKLPRKVTLQVDFCNIRSAANKIDFIFEHLNTNKLIDLFFITESWLTPAIPDAMVCPPGYSVQRCDRLFTKGGGVLLIYKQHLNIIRIDTSLNDLKENLGSDIFEIVCIDFYNGSFKLRFCCCYVPPKTSYCVTSVKTLCNMIQKLNTLPTPVYFFGDFNFPNIDWSYESNPAVLAHNTFQNFCITNCLSQHITEPTHDKGNILDLLLCNHNSKNLLISTTILPALSFTCDHFLISFNVKLSNSLHVPSPSCPYPDYRRANYHSIINDLNSINWSNILLAQVSLQTKYDQFLSILKSTINKHVPLKSKNNQTSKRPKHLVKLLNNKLKLYRKLKKDKSLKSAYKNATRAYDKAVRDWYDHIESKMTKNPSSKKFYSYVNKKLNNKSSIPPLIDKDNNLISSDIDKANLLNTNFQQSFTLDNGILPPISVRDTELMTSFFITTTDILDAISKTKDKLTRTPEGIPPYFIKRIVHSIIQPLVYLFNNFLHSNFVPKQWKQAIVIPIHKKGNQNNPKNYRPISLTSSFSRIFEAIISNKIISHLIKNNLLSIHQFGFVSGRSSCSQILSCLHDWFNNFFSNKNTSIVYADIAKAFDSVSHVKLIKIISSFGICPSVTNWLKNFLDNRTQRVVISNTYSQPVEVSSGVPQGSVIGPLMFNMFFDGITSCTAPLENDGSICLFADDAKLYSSNDIKLQSALNLLHTWTLNHQLNLAPNKCFLLKLQKPNSISTSSLHLNGQLLQLTHKIKDLGIIISDNLKWAQHINFVYSKASSRSFHLLKSFKTRNISTLIKLFKTYVRPHLEFNTPIWSPYLRKDIDKIERVQRHYTKYAFLRCGIKFDSYEDRLAQLHMASLQCRRIKFDLLLMYKIVYSMCDLNFHDFFFFRSLPYNMRGNSLMVDTHIKFKSTQWLNSFFPRSAKFWNLLPNDIVLSPTFSIFKRKLNTYDLNHMI